MIKLATANLIYLTDVACGECPVWDERHQILYWSDLSNGYIYAYNPKSGTNEVYKVGQVLGAMTLCEDSGFLVATETGFNFFDPHTGKLELKNMPEETGIGHFFGDGKCDPQGRFWAGTYHQDITDQVGSLYSLESDFSVKMRLSNIILSNGLAWSLDNRNFYYIDSVAAYVYVFDYDVITGNIYNQRVLKEIKGEMELPDGMTIDAEGFLWVAIYNGSKVIRIHPQTGETVFEVAIPKAKQVTSCTFGGKDFDELYITTAKEVGGRYGMREDELIYQPHAGGVFRVKLPFKGIPAVRFNNLQRRK